MPEFVDTGDIPTEGAFTVLDRGSLAVGWYRPADTGVELDCGYVVLNRSGGVGRAQFATLRLQWELR